MKRALQKLKVWYYHKAMNRCYAQAVWYQDHGYERQAQAAWLDGDEYRALWLEAQGAHRHPAFNSAHNEWANNLYEGDYTNYDN